MRILHVLSQSEITGAEVYAQQLSDSQLQSGHSVFVISDRLHIPFHSPWTQLNTGTRSFFERLKNIFILRNFLKSHQIDVIHCHSRGAVRHAFWARLGLYPSLISTIHGRQHSSFSKKILNIYGEYQIAVCEAVQKTQVNDFGICHAEIKIIRNPFPSPCFASTDQKKSLPENFDKTFRLAFFGRSTGPKAQRIEEIGFACFEEWLQKNPRLEITIGAPKIKNMNSEFLDHLQKLKAAHGGRIHLLDQVEQLAQKLKEYDLVFASGRIAIEALLGGTPVIASGEHETLGLVTKENFSQALSSNFGDMGTLPAPRPLAVDALNKEVFACFQKRPFVSKELHDLLCQEFDEDVIQAKIIETYKAGLFKRHTKVWIPQLMYHKIPDQTLTSQHRIFVTRERFHQHLRFFKKLGFQTLTFKDLSDFWNLRRAYSEFPQKPLLLTFDDGYTDNLTNAQPLLEQMGFRATIFLLADHSMTQNTWDHNGKEPIAELMTFEQKKLISQKTFEIGSHGLRHLDYLRSSLPEIEEELIESKRRLEKDLNCQIFCFAYPFGRRNQEIEELCHKAKYDFAVNTDHGGLTISDNPYSIFRVNVFPEDGVFDLWKKTRPWYRKYFYKKRGH